MRRETGAERVWVDADGVHCDVAGARLDSEWGCGLAEFADRADLRALVARAHGADALAEVDAAVAAELAAQVPGSPAAAARRQRDQLIGARVFADWLAATERRFFPIAARDAAVAVTPVEIDGGRNGAVERVVVVGARDGGEVRYAWERASWNPHAPAREAARVTLADGPRRFALAVGDGEARWWADGLTEAEVAAMAAMIAMLVPGAVRAAPPG